MSSFLLSILCFLSFVIEHNSEKTSAVASIQWSGVNVTVQVKKLEDVYFQMDLDIYTKELDRWIGIGFGSQTMEDTYAFIVHSDGAWLNRIEEFILGPNTRGIAFNESTYTTTKGNTLGKDSILHSFFVRDADASDVNPKAYDFSQNAFKYPSIDIIMAVGTNKNYLGETGMAEYYQGKLEFDCEGPECAANKSTANVNIPFNTVMITVLMLFIATMF